MRIIPGQTRHRAENQAKLRNLFAEYWCLSNRRHVRTLRIRGWLLIARCLAVTAVVYCTIHLRSRAPASAQAAAYAEDEVYEAVVRDMVTPVHGQAHISQLVFDDTVLTDLTTGEDKKACQESVRKRPLLDGSTPPYNSLLDKAYRVLTGGWWDTSTLRADTIQDFVEKSCTVGRLSTTFHTDFPRTFVDRDSFGFDMVPNQKNTPKDFRQTFPGASGIISLSRVGFDSTLHEAIVSSAFVCGMLCGEGRRHILRKTRGRWVVVQSLVVWIS